MISERKQRVCQGKGLSRRKLVFSDDCLSSRCQSSEGTVRQGKNTGSLPCMYLEDISWYNINPCDHSKDRDRKCPHTG